VKHRIRQLHRWDLTPTEARKLQIELACRVRFDLQCDAPRFFAGVDVAYEREAKISHAAACVLEYPEFNLVDQAVTVMKSPFPYIPGLLSFREIPPILEAFRKLSQEVDVVFVDGHGQAHPRRMGIATHLGIWLQKPTIGIGKSRLCGQYDPPGLQKGNTSSLLDRGREIGRVVRTRTGVRPVFVSSGFGLPLPRCVELTLAAAIRYRLPEPVHWADRLAANSKRVPPSST